MPNALKKSCTSSVREAHLLGLGLGACSPEQLRERDADLLEEGVAHEFADLDLVHVLRHVVDLGGGREAALEQELEVHHRDGLDLVEVE